MPEKERARCDKGLCGMDAYHFANTDRRVGKKTDDF
jgi:hypothetical protein